MLIRSAAWVCMMLGFPEDIPAKLSPRLLLPSFFILSNCSPFTLLPQIIPCSQKKTFSGLLFASVDWSKWYSVPASFLPHLAFIRFTALFPVALSLTSKLSVFFNLCSIFTELMIVCHGVLTLSTVFYTHLIYPSTIIITEVHSCPRTSPTIECTFIICVPCP